MGLGTTTYKVLFLLHIASAIVGFGAILLNGVYGAEAKKRRGAEGIAIAEANQRVSNIGQMFIYAVPLFGFGLIGVSDGIWEYDQTWIWLSLVLYVVALTVALTILKPTAKAQVALMKELTAGPPPAGANGPPPQVAQLEANGKKLAAAGGFNTIMLVVILGLMIWKPGI